MELTPWIMIAVLALIIALGGVALYAVKTQKEKRPTDYYAFFMIGLIWTIVGLPMYYNEGNFAFIAMGVVFLVLGLANKDKWEKNRVRWGDLNKNEKNLKLAIIVILGVLVFAGMIAFLLVERGILGG